MTSHPSASLDSIPAVEVRTPARLHFGLLADADHPSRHFGGAGLMIEAPAIVLRARRHSDPHQASAENPSIRSRVEHLLDRLQPTHNIAIEVLEAPAEHQGLGAGTQLSMAIGSAVARLTGTASSPAVIAQQTGRGVRSAIGVHGFAVGGFLADLGRSARDADETSVAPLLTRLDFPLDWPILLCRPALPAGLHGDVEQHAFRSGRRLSDAHTDRLLRCLVLGMIPGVIERDYPTFAAALTEYNRRVGEAFAPLQGGIYAHPLLGEIGQRLTELGLLAVGQSSWGPTFFGIADDPDRTARAKAQVMTEFGTPLGDPIITQANNVGATIKK